MYQIERNKTVISTILAVVRAGGIIRIDATIAIIQAGFGINDWGDRWRSRQKGKLTVSNEGGIA
jgi:hypothetical protein